MSWTENADHSAEDFARCTSIFETLPGWQCSTEDCRKLEDLPDAMAYLRFLADLMEVPIAIVSLGANRDQTIVVEDPIHGPKRALSAPDLPEAILRGLVSTPCRASLAPAALM